MDEGRWSAHILSLAIGFLSLIVALPRTDLPLRSAGQVKTFHLKLIEMFQCSLHCSGEGGRIRRPKKILEENRGKR